MNDKIPLSRQPDSAPGQESVHSASSDNRYNFQSVKRRYKERDPETLPFDIESNIAFVPRLGLCTMCGVCEGACPEDAIHMLLNNSKGIYEPFVLQKRCTECRVCIDVCPGFELDLTSVSSEETPSTHQSDHIGSFTRIMRARAADSSTAASGTSGGAATAVLQYLVSSNMVDGVIATRAKAGHPLEVEPFIARTGDQLLTAQKSKYMPNPMGRILKEIIRGGAATERFAWIGLPCHIEGLRLAQQAFPVLQQKIPYLFSIFCSRCPTIHATRYLLRLHNIDEEDLTRIDYRNGEHPGKLVFYRNDGTTHTVPHLHWTYWGYAFPQFFYPTRCFTCFDKTGEQADISFGDNWQRLSSESSAAGSMIIRNPAMDSIIEMMLNDNMLAITNTLTEQEFVQDQDLIKKRAMGNRLLLLRWAGRKTPIYYNHFPVINSDILRTSRLFRHVLMAEHKFPDWFMQFYITGSYLKWKATKILTRRLHKAWLGSKRILRHGYYLARDTINTFIPYPADRDPPKAPCDIVMMGGYGWRDIGDEAMPRADLLNLKAKAPHLDIVMLSPDPEYTRKYHNQRSVLDLACLGWNPAQGLLSGFATAIRTALFLTGALLRRYGIRCKLWKDARLVLDEMADARLVFNVGGGNLTSVIPMELYKKCALYLAARCLKKPVILSGQTIGPFSRFLDAQYARLALNGVHLITFRDLNTSHRRLLEIGVSRPRMIDTADDAITLPQLSASQAQSLLRKEATPAWLSMDSDITVALNLKGSLKLYKGNDRSGEIGNEIEIMARLADALVEQQNARILLVPTDYCEGVDDRILHRDIVSRMRHPERAQCLEGEYEDSQLKSIISQSDVAIGARYHFNVFAASCFVPFIGIASGEYQKTKLKGLADLCGLQQCYLEDDLEFAKLDDIWPNVIRVISERDTIKAALRKRIPELQRKSMLSIEEAIKLVLSHE